MPFAVPRLSHNVPHTPHTYQFRQTPLLGGRQLGLLVNGFQASLWSLPKRPRQ